MTTTVSQFAAAKIRELRMSSISGSPMKSMTQQELAKHCRVSRESITNVETGNQKPTLDMIFNCSRIFRVPVKTFFPAVGSEVEG